MEILKWFYYIAYISVCQAPKAKKIAKNLEK